MVVPRTLERPRTPVLLALGAATLCAGIAVAVRLGAPRALVEAVPGNPLLSAWSQWDAGWYLRIAQAGYAYTPGQQSTVAFFPLYPLLVGAVARLGFGVFWAGAGVSVVAGVAAIITFERWARTQLPPESARFATWLLALYPFAFYLYGVLYSDGLFLLLVVGAFLALEKDRPLLAAALGALATATRPVAPAVVLGLTLRHLERRRRSGEPFALRDLIPLLSAAGLLAYVAYLGLQFGEPFAFAKVQGAPGWDQPPGWHTWLKLAWFDVLFPRVAPLVAFRLVGHAVLALAGLVLVIPTWKRLGAGYGLYVLIAVGLPTLSSKDFQGLGRYEIAAFPLFATLALLLRERRWLRRGYLAASACGLAGLAAGFALGGYIA